MKDQLWWKLGKGELPAKLAKIVQQLDDDQSYRREANLSFLRLYGANKYTGLDHADYAKSEQTPKLTLNVVQSVIDSSGALISTNKPRASFLTFGGDFELQRKAKNLTKFCDGQFSNLDVYDIDKDVYQDSCIFGTGFLKVFEDKDKIKAERVFPDEILIDDQDGRYRKPFCMYQHKEVDKSILAATYPKLATLIENSEHVRGNDPFGSSLVDPVSVIEAWKRPSYDGAKDGRHVICTSNALIIDESWEEDFPFAVMRYNRRPLGYFGQGLGEILKGIQIEINYLLRKIQRHLNMGTVKILAAKGSKINKQELNNSEFGLISYVGAQPAFQTIQAISPEYYNQLESLYHKAFEVAGISEMAAQSRKPSGLDSGKAIREYNDIQSQRFQSVGQSWEKYHMDIAKQLLNRATSLDEQGKQVISIAKNKNVLEEISWKDVNLDKDKYLLQVFPTSFLPRTPAGKLQAVQELIQAFPQLQDYAMSLLDFPDLEGATNNLTAPHRILEMIAWAMVEKNEYIPPEPYMNLQAGLAYMQTFYLQSKLDNVPEENLDLIRKWMDQAAALIQASQPPQPPQGAIPPEGMPPMPPEGMPV